MKKVSSEVDATFVLLCVFPLPEALAFGGRIHQEEARSQTSQKDLTLLRGFAFSAT